jgi:hypothetical protein
MPGKWPTPHRRRYTRGTNEPPALAAHHRSESTWSGVVGPKAAAPLVAALIRGIDLAFKLMETTVAEADRSQRRPFWTAKTFFLASLALVLLTWMVLFLLGVFDWGGVERRGQFGDSFGMLSALFTGLALIGAGTAAYLQWVEMHRAAAAAAADAVEARFFQLLNSFQTALNGTRVGNTYAGRQALLKVGEWLTVAQIDNREYLNIGPKVPLDLRRADIDQWFNTFFEGTYEGGKEIHARAVDLLGHLFRMIYHIVKYVTESNAISPDDKLFYIRILRAHLANPELVLLLYNALSRHGYPKMFNLIEEHDLLQNIQIESLPDFDDGLHYKTLVEKVEVAKRARVAKQAVQRDV